MSDSIMARDAFHPPAHGVSPERGILDMDARGGAQLRRTSRADRRHASHPCRGEALGFRERFLHALNYCMLLPGPEAQQLATYIGWLMHRTLGGIMAGGLFVLPGVVSIMALSYVYAGWGQVPIVVALFFGLKAAVLAIVVEAVVRIGKRALKNQV
jgi:hypothetical protein